MSALKIHKVDGFTLIELVIVIVLLAILAVIAIPRFINLKTDAHNDSLKGVQASMYSAIAMVYAKSALQGVEKLTAGADVFIEINGSDLSTKYS